MVVPGLDIAGLSLPFDRPAAGLDTDIICCDPAHIDGICRFEDGSAWLSFLSSTSDSLTAWRATARCSAEPTICKLRSLAIGMVEKPQFEFLEQDTANRVIDPFHGDITLLHRTLHGP